MKEIKIPDCIAGQYLIFEVEETHNGKKTVFYRIKQFEGYLMHRWRFVEDFETFETAKERLDELRNKPTYKEKPVFYR